MTVLIDFVRTASWAQRIVLGSAATGLVIALRFGLGSGWVDPRIYVVQLTLASAWGACAAACLLAGLAVLEHVQRRSRGLLGSALPWWVTLWAAVALAIAMGTQLTLDFDESYLTLGLASGVVAVLAGRRRRQPAAALPAALLPLGLVVAGVQIPRELGVYSLHWKRTHTQASWSWQGGQRCSGTNAGGRPMEIAAYRPDFVIEPGVQGSLGELLNEALGRPLADAAHRPEAVTLRVHGRLDHGELGCYLPLFASDTVRANLQVDASFSIRGNDEDVWSVDCSDTRTFSLTIDASSIGIASCRDLGIDIAHQIATHIRSHAQAVSGHVP